MSATGRTPCVVRPATRPVQPACSRSHHRQWVAGALLLSALALPMMSMSKEKSVKPAEPAATAATSATVDPYLWLEEVSGERALAWVQARNRESEAALGAQAGFDARRQQIREVLDSVDQIPYVSRQGPWFYNLWRDASNPRGLWRRTTLQQYRKPQPQWETVLDIDALGNAETENWVFGGATCLGPGYQRCLLSLSRGGADAQVLREFDTVSKGFVKDGFVVPEAKTSVEWVNADTLLIGTDFGPGSMTDSGYPRVFKRWQRGQALAQAVTVFEAKTKDVSAFAQVDLSPGFERTVVGRVIDFYNTEQFLLVKGTLQRLPKPDDAEIAFWRDRVLLQLRSPWQVGSKTWPKGSLVVSDFDAFMQGKPQLELLFSPTATRSLEAYSLTRSTVILNILDRVASRLEEWRHDGKAWQKREVNAPYPGQLSVGTLYDPLLAPRVSKASDAAQNKSQPETRDDPLAEAYLLNAADFLKPDSLQLGRTGSDQRELLKSRPAFFDAGGMKVEQHFASSRDGTAVPYFVVWPEGAKADGRNPTLLYGYGGFEVSLGPWYSGSTGRVWASQGGVFVVANIRGGGEFGPAWHQAGTLKNKQNSFDDFVAVAEDLIKRKISSPRHLGIQGGSNGGLLVGAVMLQRPELFNAVVCQVPLLDMQRYHKLLAGASWMAEYGDPDKKQDWAFISRYSPYQNLKPGVRLPKVLFTTSTRDDRVHPGHARKMAARMMAQGHPLLYWENTEGGHGGAADNAQRAQMMALEYSFLWKQLGPTP